MNPTEASPRRKRLPNRRECATEEVIFRGQRLLICFGWVRGIDGSANAVREVFVDPETADTGSDLDLLLDDAATLISLLLQRGEDPRELGQRLGREGGYPTAKATPKKGKPPTAQAWAAGQHDRAPPRPEPPAPPPVGPPATVVGAIADAVGVFQQRLDGTLPYDD